MAQGPMVVNMGNQKDWLDAMSIGANIGTQMATVKAQFEQISMAKDQQSINLMLDLITKVGENTVGGARQVLQWVAPSFTKTLGNVLGMSPDQVMKDWENGILSDKAHLPEDVMLADLTGYLTAGYHQSKEEYDIVNEKYTGTPNTGGTMPSGVDYSDPSKPPKQPVGYTPPEEPVKALPVVDVEGLREVNPKQIITGEESRQVPGTAGQYPPKYETVPATEASDTGMTFEGTEKILVGKIEFKPVPGSGDIQRPVFNHSPDVKTGQIETLVETANEMAMLALPRLAGGPKENLDVVRDNIMFGIMNRQENLEQMEKLTDYTIPEMQKIINAAEIARKPGEENQVAYDASGFDDLVNATWTQMKDIVLPVHPQSRDWMDIFGNPEATPEEVETIIEQETVIKKLLVDIETNTEPPTVEQFQEIGAHFTAIDSLVGIEQRAKNDVRWAQIMFQRLVNPDPNAEINLVDVGKGLDIMVSRVFSSTESTQRIRNVGAMEEMRARISAEQARFETALVAGGVDPNLLGWAKFGLSVDKRGDAIFEMNHQINLENMKLGEDIRSSDKQFLLDMGTDLERIATDLGKNMYKPDDKTELYNTYPEWADKYDEYLAETIRQTVVVTPALVRQQMTADGYSEEQIVVEIQRRAEAGGFTRPTIDPEGGSGNFWRKYQYYPVIITPSILLGGGDTGDTGTPSADLSTMPETYSANVPAAGGKTQQEMWDALSDEEKKGYIPYASGPSIAPPTPEELSNIQDRQSTSYTESLLNRE